MNDDVTGSGPSDGRDGPSSRPTRIRSKRPLVWLAIVSLAPFVASFAVYFWMNPASRINYGTLIAGRVLPDIALARIDGTPADRALRGKWTLIVVDSAACPPACARKLYATRQARTMQGKERDRVERLWLVTGPGIPAPGLLAGHPDLVVARADPAVLAALPESEPSAAIWLVDPLGNLVLRYPIDPDIKGINRDLARLLYASRIG